MAIAIETDASKIKPLEGAVVRRATLGATTTAGYAVTLQSDGKWDPSNATNAHLTVAIAVESGADTDRVDLVTYGPVNSLTGATIGGLVYVNDAAGGLDQTGSTKKTVVGYAESATVLFVDPQVIDFS